MTNFGNMMKQAQMMQARMDEFQNRLDDTTMTGQSGGEMVKVTLTGKGNLHTIKINPNAPDPNDPEVLEDLIQAAWNDAKSKVDIYVQAEMTKISSSLGLPPGFKLPF
jgi:nucleoid-associated protein EbfC